MDNNVVLTLLNSSDLSQEKMNSIFEYLYHKVDHYEVEGIYPLLVMFKDKAIEMKVIENDEDIALVNLTIVDCLIKDHLWWRGLELLNETYALLEKANVDMNSKPQLREYIHYYEIMGHQYESANFAKKAISCYNKLSGLHLILKDSIEDAAYYKKKAVELQYRLGPDDRDFPSFEELTTIYGKHATEVINAVDRSKCLNYDPIEQSYKYQSMIVNMEEEVHEILESKGALHIPQQYWTVKKQVLKKHNLDWRSPHELNPRVHFD